VDDDVKEGTSEAPTTTMTEKDLPPVLLHKMGQMSLHLTLCCCLFGSSVDLLLAVVFYPVIIVARDVQVTTYAQRSIAML